MFWFQKILSKNLNDESFLNKTYLILKNMEFNSFKSNKRIFLKLLKTIENNTSDLQLKEKTLKYYDNIKKKTCR